MFYEIYGRPAQRQRVDNDYGINVGRRPDQLTTSRDDDDDDDD